MVAMPSDTVLGLRGWGIYVTNMPISAFSLFQPPRLRIVNNTLPKISLRSVPGLGQQVGYSTQLLVESTRYGVAIRHCSGGHHLFGTQVS